jgi:hypothetical protein
MSLLAHGNTLLRNFVSSLASDQVGVFTQDFKQVFHGARPIKASIKEYSKVFDHPLEDGATISDHRIFEPTEIELAMVLQAEDYRDAYRQIKDLYEKGTLLTVQTRAEVYDNQLIMELPHEEDAELFDAITLILKLRETQIALTPTFQPKNTNTDSSVKARGAQQSSAASPAQTQKASVAFEKLFGK